MIRTKGIIILFFILFVTLPGFTQNKSYGINFSNPKQKRQMMNFKLVNNNIIIPVSINSSDTLWFMMDTGLRNNLITELAEDDVVNINYAEKIRLHGLGQGEPLEAITSYNNNISFGKLSSDTEKINILLTDIFNLSRKAGTKINGILGYTSFKNLIVEIDYTNHRITFHNPKYYNYPRFKRRVTLPLQFIRRKPYLDTWLTLNNGKRVKVKLLIDTGSSLSLWLQENSILGISVPEKTINNLLGQGLNGDINGKIGRIKSIEFGKFILDNPIASFPDTNSINQELLVDHRNGSIGGDMLRRFRLIIDYPNKKITFIKNRHYKSPFKYNNSGVEVETPIPGVRYYQIVHIMPNSPGEKAGLKFGDQIMSINNIPTGRLSLNAINKILFSTKRKSIKFVITRDGIKQTIILKTEKLI